MTNKFDILYMNSGTLNMSVGGLANPSATTFESVGPTTSGTQGSDGYVGLRGTGLYVGIVVPGAIDTREFVAPLGPAPVQASTTTDLYYAWVASYNYGSDGHRVSENVREAHVSTSAGATEVQVYPGGGVLYTLSLSRNENLPTLETIMTSGWHDLLDWSRPLSIYGEYGTNRNDVILLQDSTAGAQVHSYGGNDSIVGGAGNDTFFKSASVASEVSTVSGGDGHDVLSFDETAVRGTITENDDGSAVVTSKSGSTVKISGVEEVRYEGYDLKTVSAGPLPYLEMAKLAADVYDDPQSQLSNYKISTGWTRLSGLDLGMGLSGDDYTYSKGLFKTEGWVSDQVGVAEVEYGLVNGLPTLALVFRGTDFGHGAGDFLSDANYWTDAETYYEKFAPLIAAFDQFARDHGVKQVVVTGHSLGGAMAQIYMSDHPPGNATNYYGATFGNPGTGRLQAFDDSRIVNFGHGEDIVNHAPLFLSGELVRVPLNDLNSARDDGPGIAEHNAYLYIDSLQKLGGLDRLDRTFLDHWEYHDPNARVSIAAGTAKNDHFGGDNSKLWWADDQLYGLAGNDTIKGYAGADTIQGGDGKDHLYGGVGADVLCGYTIRNSNDNDRDVFHFSSVADAAVGRSLDDVWAQLGGSTGDRFDLTELPGHFTWLGGKSFTSHHPNQIRVVGHGSHEWLVQVSTDSDKSAEMAFVVHANRAPIFSDFVV